MEAEQTRQSLAEENCRLREELSQCKDDKEFVWMLWKDLQKQNPDMTSTIDMIITREALKCEQVIKELEATVQAKHHEAVTLGNELDEKKREVIEQNAKLSRMETEIALLEGKLKSQQLKLQKEAEEAQLKLVKMEERHTELESKLEQQKSDLLASNEETKGILLKHDEQKRKYEKLKIENNSKDLLIQHLEGEVVHLKQRVEDLSQQRVEHEEILQRQQAELQSAKNELTEVSRSRDAWASHTTLQSSAIQQLQRENNQLKEELSKQTHSYSREDVEMEQGCQREEESAGRSQDFLESVEKELFETRLQLKAKCTELKSLRSSHDRRMKRMHVLQTSHKLLEEQLQTYEGNR